VSEEAKKSLEDFIPQNLANVVWSLATTDYPTPKLLEAVVERAEERIGEFIALV